MFTNLLGTCAKAVMPTAGLLIVFAAANSTATAAPAELQVRPTSVPAGQSVQVAGKCESNTQGFVLSHAFLHDASHDFAGVGAVSFSTDAAGNFSTQPFVPATIPPGAYSITARCGGGNLGISATLTVTRSGTAAPPTAVPAGSGGRAATGDRAAEDLLALGGGALLIAVASVALVRRSRARR